MAENTNKAFMNVLKRFPDNESMKEYSGKSQEYIENILRNSDEFATNNRTHIGFNDYMKTELSKYKTKIYNCPTESESCAFIAEGRNHRDIQVVVKKVLDNIPNTWCLEVVCTQKNLSYIQSELRTVKNIKFNTIDNLDNMNDYNNLMLSKEFWNWLFDKYKNILIFQTDVIMFKPINDEFMQFDFIGAPCIEKTHMNGGFSFRKIESMINVLNLHSPQQNEEEDKFFCRYLPKVDFELSRRFSSEHIPSCDIPVGIHKAWIYNPSYFKYLASITSQNSK
jgi:hypothetical protein